MKILLTDVSIMVTEWQNELQVFCKIGKTQPHAAYAAFTMDLCINSISCAEPLQIYKISYSLCIRFNFIPSLCGRAQPT